MGGTSIMGLLLLAANQGSHIEISAKGKDAPQALADMCEAAYDDGVLLVAAAGNSGPGANTVGFPAKYRGRYWPWQ